MPKDWQETEETKDLTDTHDSGTGLSSEGIRAMQGIEPTTPPNDGDTAGDGTEPAALSVGESDQVTLEELKKKRPSDTLSPGMAIAASEFKPETQTALKEQGLDDPDGVLDDKTGKKGEKAEALAQTVLKHEGLPDGSGGVQPLKDVVPGKFDPGDRGIDLIGVTPDGRPIPIEVKKRAKKDQDSMGTQEPVKEANMEPETLALKENILRERAVNPALRGEGEQRLANGEPDRNLSADQMAGLWTRDRWLKLIKNDERRAELAQAGVSEEFLNLDNFKVADSPQWRAFLDGRTTVIVTGDKDDVTDKLFQEAVFERGFDVAVINLKA